jgi:hypothetical protein
VTGNIETRNWSYSQAFVSMERSFRFRRTVLGIAITVLVVTAVGVAVLSAFIWHAAEQFTSCRNIVLGSIRSPDDTKSVFIFRQECNAIVPDSMYASIAPTDRPFTPDRDHAFLGFVGRGEVLSNWRGDDAVEVAFVPAVGSFIKREKRVDNVEIDYK